MNKKGGTQKREFKNKSKIANFESLGYNKTTLSKNKRCMQWGRRINPYSMMRLMNNKSRKREKIEVY